MAATRPVPSSEFSAPVTWAGLGPPGTGSIHLQNIYARLQVPSRTAAVTRAFPGLG